MVHTPVSHPSPCGSTASGQNTLQAAMGPQKRFSSRIPRISKKRRMIHEPPEKPAEEWQLLQALQLRGDLSVELETAWNAQAYLEARKIPVELACRLGVVYVVPGMADQWGEWVRPWEDRLIFPLVTATGDIGFTGRLLTHWQCCRDAAAHQARLHAQGHHPWRKTGAGGWFWDPHRLPSSNPVIVVEGPFDRLAILAEGIFDAGEIVALTGMAFQSSWLSEVNAVLLALNHPSASKQAQTQFQHYAAWKQEARVEVARLPAAGGNWSERWRREGAIGLQPLYVDHALLAHGL